MTAPKLTVTVTVNPTPLSAAKWLRACRERVGEPRVAEVLRERGQDRRAA